ncbi:MAG: hypothetical protein AMJ79_16055, partial [Phycisphaerae bacterium SM23_30]
KKNTRKFLLAVALAVLIGGAILAKYLLVPSAVTNPADAAYVAKRRDLTINVVENGEVKARYTNDIKCQAEGYDITITYLIEEGTIITDQDVADGKILVELDSSQLSNEFTQLDMSYNNSKAAYEEAIQQFEIQIKQNESDINAARLKEKFALLELKKYLGEDLTQQLLRQNENHPDDQWADPNLDLNLLRTDPNALCQASQKLRQLQNNIYLSEEELRRAQAKLEGSKKLYANKYITKMDLQVDQLNYERNLISLNEKKAELQLFLKYDLNKEAEKLFHDYVEAKLQTERQRAQARSRLTMAEAKKNSTLLRLTREEEYLNRVKKSLDACTIRAPAAGMVIYARDQFAVIPDRRIEQGGRVYYRQRIITIPSTSEMIVDVKIHETYVNMVEPNQLALITLDAFPDQTFTGAVLSVDHLPDSTDRWLTGSELKVYLTKVSIDGAHDFIRDGMSAKVEIIVDQLQNALCIPVQAVANIGDEKMCYVIDDDGAKESRLIEIGSFNNHYIEVKQGLKEGEKVSLIPERYEESIEQIEEKKKDMIEKARTNKNKAPSPEISK